jgi:hypothetical protein
MRDPAFDSIPLVNGVATNRPAELGDHRVSIVRLSLQKCLIGHSSRLGGANRDTQGANAEHFFFSAISIMLAPSLSLRDGSALELSLAPKFERLSIGSDGFAAPSALR